MEYSPRNERCLRMSFVESIRSGEVDRKLIASVVAIVVVMVLAASAGVYNLAKRVVEVHTTPYQVVLPVEVLSRVDGVDGPATDGDVLEVLIVGCNNTSDPLVLSITGQWVQFSTDGDGGAFPSRIVPDQLHAGGIAVPPGGAFCSDDTESTPSPISLVMPESVTDDPGTWQVTVQVEVRECENFALNNRIGSTLVQCRQVGDVVDHVGWFSQIFTVV